MTSSEYISYLKNPELLATVTIDSLQQIVSEYPYFTGARMLLTKKMQLTQHLHLKKEIKKTALSVPNRALLYKYLYQETIQNQIKKSFDFTPVAKEEVTQKITNPPVQNEPIEEQEKSVKSNFNQPISFNNLANSSSELDALEKQIISSTLEHVLADEILKTTTPPPSEIENLPPNAKETQKFSEWLEILDHQRLSQSEKNAPINANQIIDSFLEKDIQHVSPSGDEKTYTPSNLARLSIVDDNEFVTETLAKIYFDQGNLSKALAAYKQLLLKNPEKKTYFAAQIEKIETELKTKK